MDDLVSAGDIAERLNVTTPNEVRNWPKRYPDFPEPIVRRPRAVLWLWPDVERWAISTGRLEP